MCIRDSFKPGATRLADMLVAQQKLEPGELFHYAVVSFPATEEKRRQGPDPLQVEELPVPTALTLGLSLIHI